MQKVKRILAITAFFSDDTSVAVADEINLYDAIKQKLPMHELRSKAKCLDAAEFNPFLGNDCYKLEFRNVQLTHISTKYSDVKRSPEYDDFGGDTITIQNCTDHERQETSSTSMEVTEKYTITKTTSITNTLGASAELNIFGLKIGMTNDVAVNFANPKEISSERKITYKEDISEPVSPYTYLSIKITRRLFHSYLNFAATYRVSGRVVMVVHTVVGSPDRDIALGQIGDYTKDPIILRGRISTNSLSQDKTKSVHDVRYTETTCPK
jgi:hypothetical protein